MWFFKKKAPPYNLGNKLFSQESPIHYALFDGTRVSDQKEFSIFEIKSDQSPFQQALADNAIKIWKTFRHPAIPLFVDSYENDGATYIVTDKLIPFDDRELSDSEIAWAIYTMTEFVNFLSEDANAIHGNILENSLFLTYGHELKIAGFHWMTVHGQGPITDYYQQWSQSTQFALPKPAADSPLYSIDVRFIGYYLKKWENKMPKSITKFASRWTPNFNRPPSPKLMLEQNFWKTDKFMLSITFLRDLPLKDSAEIDAFLKELVGSLDTFSVQTQEYTLLPILLSSLSFSQTPSVIDNILTIGHNIGEQSFQSKIIPKILPLFECKDRNIRVHLLSHINDFISFFSQKIINETIFPNVIIGLNDTAIAVKAATIISMVSLAPFLTSNNSKSLVRDLERLQSDQDSSIRCNSVICIAKIAASIDQEYRTPTLVSCFANATKDSFAATRKAAVSAYKTCLAYFTPQIIAINIMPTLSPLCVDQNFEVRVMALKLMRELIELIGKDYLDEDENQSKQEQKIPPTTTAQTKPKPANATPQFPQKNETKNNDAFWDDEEFEQSEKKQIQSRNKPKKPEPIRNQKVDDDGWDDEPIVIKSQQKSNIRNQKVDDDDGWGFDDDFEIKKQTTASRQHLQQKSSSNIRNASQQPSNIRNSQTHNSQEEKKAQNQEDVNNDDGWGDLDEMMKPKQTTIVKNTSKPINRSNATLRNRNAQDRNRGLPTNRGKRIIVHDGTDGWDEDIDWDDE